MADPVVRDLPQDTQDELEIDFTRPVYLVKMIFDSGTVYLSSSIQITFDGDVYIEGQVSVGTVSWDESGSQTGSLILSNENDAATALILGNSVNDVLIGVST